VFGAPVARASTLALAFFPTPFFFGAVYTEALFLALAARSLWALHVRGNLALAALLCGLVTATRDVGILLLIPLGDEVIRRRSYSWPRALAPIPLAVSGLAGYMLYLWAATGSRCSS
jgi:Gpi18-like mannosyltransferase